MLLNATKLKILNYLELPKLRLLNLTSTVRLPKYIYM